jgi:predicted naringenin-chalcone synthase
LIIGDVNVALRIAEHRADAFDHLGCIDAAAAAATARSYCRMQQRTTMVKKFPAIQIRALCE